MSSKENMEFDDFKAGKNLPFSVPDGYFDGLPSRIQDKVNASVNSNSIVEREGWMVSLRSQLAFAAGFVFMAVLGYFGYYLSRPLTQQSRKSAGTDYVEIVSRTISDFEDIDLYRAIENKKRQDSLDKATRELYQRYYVRSNNCISIIDEKKEIEP